MIAFIRAHATELNAMIDPKRDFLLDYFGFKTLERAYLMRDRGRKIVETPQFMWLRVAVGVWGIFFLAGLLLTTFVVSMAGNSFGGSIDADSEIKCNLLSLGSDGKRMSKQAPLSIVVFSYTLGFLGYIIGKYNLAKKNIPTLVILPMLIVAETFWQVSNKCIPTPIAGLLISIVVGGGLGALWSYIIDKMKLTKLQYFNGLSTKETCELGKDVKFKCTKKN